MFLKESEAQLKKCETNDPAVLTETIEKFDKIDLYKSIFLSDSEDDDIQDGGDKEKRPAPTSYNEFADAPKNVERNLSPPRGIFAHIDFDELNSWNKPPDQKASENAKEKESVTEVIEDDSNIYGPKIPESLLRKTERESDNFRPEFRRKEERDKDIQVISSSSSDSWVEVSEGKKDKKLKKKKSKKHKSKHKKSKHKKKDK